VEKKDCLASLTDAYSICPDAAGQLFARCRCIQRQLGFIDPARNIANQT
jgi:hypothetical protein